MDNLIHSKTNRKFVVDEWGRGLLFQWSVISCNVIKLLIWYTLLNLWQEEHWLFLLALSACDLGLWIWCFDSDGSFTSPGWAVQFFVLGYHVQIDLSLLLLLLETVRHAHKLAKNNVGRFYSICASTIWTKFRMSLMPWNADYLKLNLTCFTWKGRS